MLGDFQHPLAGHISAAEHVFQKRHDVWRPVGPAERDDQQGVVRGGSRDEGRSDPNVAPGQEAAAFADLSIIPGPSPSSLLQLPLEGVEPPLSCENMDLNHAHLPIPPQRRGPDTHNHVRLAAGRQRGGSFCERR